MTLLVLDLRVPNVEAIQQEQDPGRALISMSPRFVMFAMSVMTLGIFWIGQLTQLNHPRRSRSRSDMDSHWVPGVRSVDPLFHCITGPIPAIPHRAFALLDQSPTPGATLYWSWVRARGTGLVNPDLSPEIFQAMKRRIVASQSLHALAAALCMIDTRLSIAAIVLLRLNYALAPRITSKG